MSDLSVSIPAALATFCRQSGYKLNFSKNELMPLNEAAKRFPLHHLLFKIAHSSSVYLSVHVTNRFENLFQAYYASLLTHTKNDLECWSLQHLSLVARINSLEMNILPKFLYLLPVFLPNTFLKKVDSIILPLSSSPFCFS